MSLLPPFSVCHLIGSQPGTQVIYWPLVFHSLLNLQPTGMGLTCPEQTWASGACPPSLPGGHLSCFPGHDPGIQPSLILPPLLFLSPLQPLSRRRLPSPGAPGGKVLISPAPALSPQAAHGFLSLRPCRLGSGAQTAPGAALLWVFRRRLQLQLSTDPPTDTLPQPFARLLSQHITRPFLRLRRCLTGVEKSSDSQIFETWLSSQL